MARFPQSEIEELKRETDLAALVRRSGVELSAHGEDLLGLCPFHDDHSPSLVVSPAKGLWHCLGACRAGGSAIDWVMRREGVSFRHAVVLLKNGFQPRAARPLTMGRPPVKPKEPGASFHSSVRHLPPPLSLGSDDRKLLSEVVDYYHRELVVSSSALGYLERRSIRSDEAIERFRLGYSDKSLGLRIPHRTRLVGGELRGRLEKLGVYRKTGHEHLAGCLVFPIFDAEGQVANLYGRKLLDPSRPELPKHLYLPGPRRGIWNLDALRESKELIFCEALVDALTFWCHGFRNVTTSYGVNGFTEELHEALRAYGIERLLVAYDRDDAGDAAADALAKRLGTEGIGCFRIHFPKGMDANDLARKMKPADQALALAVKGAEWMAGPTKPKKFSVSKQPASPAAAKEESGRESTGAPPPPTTTRLPESFSSLAASQGVDPVADVAREAPPVASEEEAETKASLKEKDQDPPAVSEAAPPSLAGDLWEATLGDRSYRARGLDKNLSYEQLRVTLRVSRGESFFLDTVDLVSARQRAQYVRQAAVELSLKEDVVKKDLGKVHFELEALQDALIKKTLEPKGPRAVAIPPEEAAEALEFLRAPDLLERILTDFDRCGVVGETTNKLLGYLAGVSRKLEEPLAIIIQSSSAAGKSALMEAILALMPEEERIAYSAMTGQSLFYMGERDLAHKILAVAEEEGAERASYALKLLQSEGELTIASTGKDPHTGKLVTHEYRVEGPVAIFLTTTAIDIDEELLNRCIVLTVDEDREQTRAIHRLQRERRTLEGFLAKREREAILRRHRNAQRLLKPIPVVNPYAPKLTFLDHQTRTRRDHEKYLTLIETVTLLHQHQRLKKEVTDSNGQRVEILEVTPEDIAVANRLADEAFGRSLDELPPQTRRLLDTLDRVVSENCERDSISRSDLLFSRRDVRGWTGWSLTQVRLHLDRLVAMEYVLAHRGTRGQSFVYELVYDGRTVAGKRLLVGLIDSESLKVAGSEGHLAGSKSDLAGGWRGQNAPKTGGWRGSESAAEPSSEAPPRRSRAKTPRNVRQGEGTLLLPYSNPAVGEAPSPLLSLAAASAFPETRR
jgi:DNA primase